MIHDLDVLVIGAGAAGLAAGLTLRKVGAAFKIIEAQGRIGGRAWTDHSTFPGIPYDKGCHWLHCASVNPFVEIADKLGFRYKAGTSWRSQVLLVGEGRQADRQIVEASREALYAAMQRIADAGLDGRDVPFSDVLDPSDPWYRLIYRTLTQVMSGDPERCSTLDFARYHDTDEDYPVEGGLGALVARNAGDLEVELNTPAYRIDWSGSGVRVETARGTLSAKAVVVAVPPTIMSAGRLRFAPDLPARTEGALHHCPLGTFEKYTFLLDRPLDGLDHCYSDVIDGPPLTRRPFNLHIHPFGRPLVTGHIGGSVGREIEQAGEAAMYEAGLDALVHAFGSGIRHRIRASDFTHWTSDPWALGAYSHCLPGYADARPILNEAVGDRIFFAGEHTSLEFFATVHGAHISGITAATRALRA